MNENYREIDEQMGDLQRLVTGSQWRMIENVVAREFPPARGVAHTSHMDAYRAGLVDIYQGCIDALRDQAAAGHLNTAERSARGRAYNAMSAFLRAQ